MCVCVYGCLFGALKLCERCTHGCTVLALANLLCYRDIHMVLGTRPNILGCPSRFGQGASGVSPELTEIISEIVDLGDHLYCSGYCPVPRVPY